MEQSLPFSKGIVSVINVEEMFDIVAAKLREDETYFLRWEGER